MQWNGWETFTARANECFCGFQQVLSRTSETDPLGWWPARIKMMKGEFVVVDYVGYETTYSDISPLDHVRPMNKK